MAALAEHEPFNTLPPNFRFGSIARVRRRVTGHSTRRYRHGPLSGPKETLPGGSLSGSFGREAYSANCVAMKGRPRSAIELPAF